MKRVTKLILKSSATFMVTCAITLSSFITLTYKALDEDLLDNKKYMDKVEEELGANMKIMEMHGESVSYPGSREIIRLAPNSDGIIPVNIDGKISQRTKSNIQQALGEFNELFTHINDDYNFVECSEEELEKRKEEGDSTIKFDLTKFESNAIQGLTQSKVMYQNNLLKKGKQAFYISDSTVSFDETRFDELTDDSQLTIIKHEILHTLGFADIYSNYFDETSLVNVNIGGVSTHISPNDFKMLYVAYGNKHINKFGFYDQEKMDEVKKMIDEYEVKYYQYLISTLTNYTGGSFQKIENNDLVNGQTFEKKGITFTIKDGEYFYTDKYGEQRSGKLIYGDNYVVLADVQRPKTTLAALKTQNEEREYYNDFYVLLKDEKGLNIYDFEYVHKQADNPVDKFVRDLEVSMR